MGSTCADPVLMVDPHPDPRLGNGYGSPVSHEEPEEKPNSIEN